MQVTTDPTDLTHAERGVLLLLLSGLPYAEIAAQRVSSKRTVANQIAAAYRKLGTRSRTELAARQFPIASVLCCSTCVADALPELSARERAVVYASALGHTNKWIAFDLASTPSSVASHLRRAMRKLGVVRRVALARTLFERASAMSRRHGVSSVDRSGA